MTLYGKLSDLKLHDVQRIVAVCTISRAFNIRNRNGLRLRFLRNAHVRRTFLGMNMQLVSVGAGESMTWFSLRWLLCFGIFEAKETALEGADLSALALASIWLSSCGLSTYPPQEALNFCIVDWT